MKDNIRRATKGRLLFGMVASMSLLLPPVATSAATAEDYARADRIRGFDNRSIGGTIFPHWLADGRHFYYQSFGAHEEPGTVFLVDPQARSKRALFKLAALAGRLSEASGQKIDQGKLPAWRLLDAESLTARVAGRDYGSTSIRTISQRLAVRILFETQQNLSFV